MKNIDNRGDFICMALFPGFREGIFSVLRVGVHENGAVLQGILLIWSTVKSEMGERAPGREAGAWNNGCWRKMVRSWRRSGREGLRETVVGGR